jgi:hypothetical protein
LGSQQIEKKSKKVAFHLWNFALCSDYAIDSFFSTSKKNCASMKKQLCHFALLLWCVWPAWAQYPGDLIITEFMAHSKGVPDAQGEYIELYNTAFYPVNLNGCIIQDASALYVAPAEDVWIEPGEFAVIGRSAVPAAAYYFPSYPPPFNLNNIGGDQISVTCHGTLIAFVSYTANQTSGVAMELIDVHLHENGITQEADYAPATHLFRYNGASVNDRGSPGFAGNTFLLPVEFSYFEARLEGARAVLEWATASEQDNSHFIVEHSLDGISFEGIGRVEGAGTTIAPQYYRLEHGAPRPGFNYYRLRQVDYDGSVSWSEVRSLAGPSLEQPCRLYPTAAQDVVTLELAAPATADLTLGVYDLQGRWHKSQVLPAGAWHAQVEVSGLPAGAYLLHWQGGGGAGSERFIKQ